MSRFTDRSDRTVKPSSRPGGDGSVVPVSQLLWRPPLTVELGRSDARPDRGTLVSEFLVAPHRRAPALLLPGRSGRAAAQAVLRPSEGSRGLQRAGRRAAWVALRSGLGRLLLRDRLYICANDPASARSASIETHLREIFGPDILVALAVGPMRANRKPVLQVLTPHGRVVAFVKAGWNPLTRRLVRAETATLRRLESTRLGPVQLPEVLHVSTWQDLTLLAIAPLIGTGRRHRTLGRPHLNAIRALATSEGTEVLPLANSPYWHRLRDQLTALPDTRARETVLTIQRAAGLRWGSTPVAFGAWHGDWTKWNMAWDGDRVLLWDWERYQTDVPVGLDAFHYAMQARLRGQANAAGAVAHVRRAAPGLAAGMGLPAEHGQQLLLCYLLSLLVRYESDSDNAMGMHLRPLVESLRGVADQYVTAR